MLSFQPNKEDKKIIYCFDHTHLIDYSCGKQFLTVYETVSLIPMPLCDLQKQARPSARRLATSINVVILNACHQVNFSAK